MKLYQAGSWCGLGQDRQHALRGAGERHRIRRMAGEHDNAVLRRTVTKVAGEARPVTFLLALTDTEGIFSRLSERRLVRRTGLAAADVPQNEADRPSYSRIRPAATAEDS